MRHSDAALHPTREYGPKTGPQISVANGRSFAVPRISLLPLHRVLVFFLIVAYAVTFVSILRWIISVRFAYEGYEYLPIDRVDGWIWAWSLAILPAMFLPIEVRKPSQFLVWILTLIVYIPAILVPPYALGFGFEYAPYQAVLFVCLTILSGVGLLPAVRLPVVQWSLRTYIIGLLAYSVVILGYIISQVGLPTSIPSFANVYAQRSAYGEAFSSPGPLTYLIAWQTSVINPLLILIGLSKRKWTIVGIGLALNVLMYSIAGHKSHLLSSVLVIGLFVLLNIAARLRGTLLAIGAIVLMTITSLMYTVGDMIFPVSIFVRRLIAVPGMLTGYYFEYFSESGFTERFGPLSILFNPIRMDLSTPNTIGLEYFGNERMAANANFWADGFSAFGLTGVVLATLFLAILLWIMDSLTVARTALVATPLFVVAMYSLTNSALPTSLLTHGILFTVLVVLLYPASEPKHGGDSRSRPTSLPASQAV